MWLLHSLCASYLSKICKIEKPNMIISGPEEEILTITKNKEIFRKQNIVILSPDYKNVKICSDKMKTYEKLEEYILEAETVD